MVKMASEVFSQKLTNLKATYLKVAVRTPRYPATIFSKNGRSWKSQIDITDVIKVGKMHDHKVWKMDDY